MVGNKRSNRNSGGNRRHESGRWVQPNHDGGEYRQSPWIQNDAGAFGQPAGYGPAGFDFPQPNYTSFRSEPNKYGQDPDSILKELGKCYLNSLSGTSGAGPAIGNVYGASNYPQDGYRRVDAPRGFRRYETGSKRFRENSASSKSNSGYNGVKSNGGPNNSRKRRRPNGDTMSSDKTRAGRANDNKATGKNSGKTVNSAKSSNSKGSAKTSHNNAKGVANKVQSTTTSETVKKPVVNGSENSPNKTGPSMLAKKGTRRKRTAYQVAKRAAKFSKDPLKKNSRNRFNKLKENSFLDENDKVVVSFLTDALHDLIKDDGIHFSLTFANFAKHRNASRIFQHELRTFLDQKFDDSEKKQEFLNQQKDKRLTEWKEMRVQVTEEEMVARTKLLDDVIEVLTAEIYPKDLVPQAEDMMVDPAVTPSVEELTRDLKYQFLFYVYDAMSFVLLPTKASKEQLIKYHLDKGVIPALLIEVAKNKTLKSEEEIKLPASLEGYLKWKTYFTMFLRHKNTNFVKAMYHRAVREGIQFETNIFDVLPAGARFGTRLIKDLAECILMFDIIASAVKLRLIYYTREINLSEEEKLAVVNEMVRHIYTQVLDVLEKNVPLVERTFDQMEGTEDVELKTEPATVELSGESCQVDGSVAVDDPDDWIN